MLKPSDLTVVLDPGRFTHLAALLSGRLRAQGHPTVVTSGEQSPLRALQHAATPWVVLHRLDQAPAFSDYAPLVQPLQQGEAAATFGRPAGARGLGKALAQAAERWTLLPLEALGSGVSAFDTRALKNFAGAEHTASLEAQLAVDLHARKQALVQVMLSADSLPPITSRARWTQLRALVQRRIAAAEGGIEGFVTLERMEEAVAYNTWLGRKFRPHLGQRVLEVGAGLGTITEQLAPGREQLIALEVQDFFVERLRKRFQHLTQVKPYLSGVELADWKALGQERIETVVLSNVLEHIEDDAQAVRNFWHVLAPGGKLLILVPALPVLFGSLDRSVGHFRRYTPDTLRTVLTQNGFVLESMEWLNLLGIPGWFVNGRVFRRKRLPAFQLKVFDALLPWVARLESRVRLPVGMSLFAVARAEADR